MKIYRFWSLLEKFPWHFRKRVEYDEISSAYLKTKLLYFYPCNKADLEAKFFAIFSSILFLNCRVLTRFRIFCELWKLFDSVSVIPSISSFSSSSIFSSNAGRLRILSLYFSNCVRPVLIAPRWYSRLSLNSWTWNWFRSKWTTSSSWWISTSFSFSTFWSF